MGSIRINLRKNRRKRGEVGVSEADGVRYLHLGNDAVQSAMRIRKPFDLELSYTRAMMAGLLLHPAPRNVVMIGLGGGSIAKFVHRKLPDSAIHVVELNPKVVLVARNTFGLPPDDERLTVQLGDGAAYTDKVRREARPCADLFMVDGFDDLAQVQALASRPFYDNVMAALKPGGILVVNLLLDDLGLDRYLRRIEAACPGGTLCLEAEDEPNLIVFGFRDPLHALRWDTLQERAKATEKATGLKCAVLLKGLRKMNESTRTLLKIRPTGSAGPIKGFTPGD
jgi:spermidine synthase